MKDRFRYPQFEALTVGKNKKDQSLNEDLWVTSKDTFAVVDGSKPRIPLDFRGKSGAQFAAEAVRIVLLNTNSSVNGAELVGKITEKLNERIDKIGFREVVNKNPLARPAALFSCARITGEEITITALGDVGVKVNGKVVHSQSFETEEAMAEKRIQAMQKAYKKNPHLSADELFKIGVEAISRALKQQYKYFNNSNSELGLGIIDGNVVPEKFIKVYKFDLRDVKSIEIFSDGYFILPDTQEIKDWERGFTEGEEADPLRWRKYPAVKGAFKDNFSDDRTILIVKFT
ncbi:hypothetical protein C4559_04240 [Candidatus Microgenomates bacterium]|nr:MAG: hypothetical protein C4559_04240 [Candidatus Microgenomates bacterium]